MSGQQSGSGDWIPPGNWPGTGMTVDQLKDQMFDMIQLLRDAQATAKAQSVPEVGGGAMSLWFALVLFDGRPVTQWGGDAMMIPLGNPNTASWLAGQDRYEGRLAVDVSGTVSLPLDTPGVPAVETFLTGAVLTSSRSDPVYKLSATVSGQLYTAGQADEGGYPQLPVVPVPPPPDSGGDDDDPSDGSGDDSGDGQGP